MTSTATFTIASSANNARAVGLDSGTYPPGEGMQLRDTALIPARIWTGANYRVDVGLFRWDTSSLPYGVIVTNAQLRVECGAAFADGDGRSITADWYVWDGSSASDHSVTAGTNALAGALISTSFAIGSPSTLTLLNPNDYISRTGYTYLRLHVSGGPPTAYNNIQIEEYGNTNGKTPAQLIVDYIDFPGQGRVTSVPLSAVG